MTQLPGDIEPLGYVKLAEAPTWCIQYPTCSACTVDLETDGDGWSCPNCGTQWDMDASDGDSGTLYADYYGEEPTGPQVTEKEAADWGHYRERLDQHRRWGDKYPTLYPEPKRPAQRVTRTATTSGDDHA